MEELETNLGSIGIYPWPERDSQRSQTCQVSSLHINVFLSACFNDPCQFTMRIGDSIFIDDEENVRLGDFGLATSNRPSAKPHGTVPESEADALYDSIDDNSGLLGAASNSSANRNHSAISMASITGGVGTALYMAPEQEFSKSMKGKPSYDSKADIFSLGVLLFEMFMLKVSYYFREWENNTFLPFAKPEWDVHVTADRLHLYGTGRNYISSPRRATRRSSKRLTLKR